MKRSVNSRGLSLVEVLASVTLFSVVAAALSATTIATIKFNNVSKNTAVASALVHDEIERLRTLDTTVAQPDLTGGDHSDPRNPVTELGKDGGRFTRTWSVVPSTPRIGVSLVVVTVTWTDSQTRSVAGSTYVCSTGTCS